jgi:hypothetical protein
MARASPSRDADPLSQVSAGARGVGAERVHLHLSRRELHHGPQLPPVAAGDVGGGGGGLVPHVYRGGRPPGDAAAGVPAVDGPHAAHCGADGALLRRQPPARRRLQLQQLRFLAPDPERLRSNAARLCHALPEGAPHSSSSSARLDCRPNPSRPPPLHRRRAFISTRWRTRSTARPSWLHGSSTSSGSCSSSTAPTPPLPSPPNHAATRPLRRAWGASARQTAARSAPAARTG